MSFIRSTFSTFSNRKILSSFFILFTLLPAVYFVFPSTKAQAQFAVEPGPVWSNVFLIPELADYDNIDVSTDETATVVSAALPVIATAAVTTAKVGVTEQVHQFWLKAIAWYAAKAIVQQITAQTVNWINSGFNGNPAYVTDPDQFFENIGDNTVINALGNGSIFSASTSATILKNICSPFQPQIRLALVQQYMNQNQVGQCSIQNTIKNYDAFTQNFENGGWDGWFSVTQNMQNNPYGAYIQAQDSLTLQIANQQTKYKTQLIQGNGFLSWQKCTGPDPTMPATGTVSDITANTTFSGTTQTCTTQTPGSVIQSQLEHTLGASVDQLNLANDINQLVGAVMVQGIKGIFGGIQDGLKGLSESSQTNNSSVVSQLMNSSIGVPSGLTLTSADGLTQAGNTIPSTSIGAVGTSTADSLSPTIDENAIQTEIDQQAAALQAQANQVSGANTQGTCTYTSTTGVSTTAPMSQTDCAGQSGTFAPDSTATTTSSNGVSGTNANNTTCTSITPSQTNGVDLPISNVLGYNVEKNIYTDNIYANSTLVIIATVQGNLTGFSPGCYTVTLGTETDSTHATTNPLVATYPATYISNKEIDVQLGATTGSFNDSYLISGSGAKVLLPEFGITSGTASDAEALPTQDLGFTPQTNSTGGVSSTDVNVCTATSTNVPLHITGLQGYSATTTNVYTSAVYHNNYLIVYGSGFNPACDTVSVSSSSGSATYTPSYVSSTQLNVLLGSATGDENVTVSSAAASSNTESVDIQ